jgi:hypothetical protein
MQMLIGIASALYQGGPLEHYLLGRLASTAQNEMDYLDT